MVRQAVRALLATLLMMVAAAASAQLPAGAGPHVAMRLVPESATPAAGSIVTFAINARPQPGWHGYWNNPGDAGVATQATWSLPPGARAGALAYPVPGRLVIGGLMNYVYEAPFALLAEVRLPEGLARGTSVPVAVKLDYLVCTHELCVPETQTLATTLTIGDGTVDAATRARFDAWRRAIPRPLGSVATWQRDGTAWRLAVPYPASAPLRDAWFYPDGADTIAMAAPQRVTRDGDRVVIETDAANRPGSAPAGRVTGVLAIGDGQGLSLAARPGVVAPAAGSGGLLATTLLAFAGAVLGGLILNVMPCVFPILSLKALGLARSGESAAAARGEALAYTAGAVLACLALGAVLLAVRAGGSAAGWAFQLQEPRMVVVLLLLAVAITLNLIGVFELPVPRFAGERAGAAGAFGTGALAAFVATPCAGPFMGAALGAALVLPVAAALAVFAGLGLGLALPFLAIGFVPALRRRLPKPGAWMVTLRRVLAVPMALTAAALLWLLGQEAGQTALLFGAGMAALLALVAFAAGRRQRGGGAGGLAMALGTATVALLAVLALPVETHRAGMVGGERFTEARLAALRAQKRPVFAYFTADWCLTCKVNEKAAIDTATARDAFTRGNVAVLVGDWTDGDPALGRFIQAHGRAGVPLYLWYPANGGDARVLPQVLTPGMLAALPTN